MRGVATSQPATLTTNDRRRWWMLAGPCLALFMISVDTTVVNVALPSMSRDLHFSEASLSWGVNAYLVTYGGSLVLGARLGDVFGNRRTFLVSSAIFSLTSPGCGSAPSQLFLVGTRAMQGFSGAVV